eukprot:6527143-Prymnesium_polylepis.1
MTIGDITNALVRELCALEINALSELVGDGDQNRVGRWPMSADEIAVAQLSEGHIAVLHETWRP